jgi:lipopolysaccharide transport system permease protein
MSKIMNRTKLVTAADENWDIVVDDRIPWFNLRFRELWHYHELILLFVKRDFTTYYKQTILGFLWYIIQPLFSTVVFTVVFGKFAKIPTDNVPPFLFYLSGNVVWMYFAGCLTDIAGTFVSNASIFGKVYFPRLTVPISVVLTKSFQLLIQFTLFICFLLFFMGQGAPVKPNWWCLALPGMFLQLAILGLGTGILISSMTTKYRDLIFAMTFFVQLWMYLSPIVYPLSQVPERFRMIYNLNPMVAIVESFRYAFLGVSAIEPIHIAISWTITFVVALVGIVFFNRIEKTFIDTV